MLPLVIIPRPPAWRGRLRRPPRPVTRSVTESLLQQARPSRPNRLSAPLLSTARAGARRGGGPGRVDVYHRDGPGRDGPRLSRHRPARSTCQTVTISVQEN